MTQPISGSMVRAAQVQSRDSDGDNDGSKSSPASSGSNVGPAVILNLTNVAGAAQGDPDHDGK